jgi:type VI secretion system protein ImpA
MNDLAPSGPAAGAEAAPNPPSVAGLEPLGAADPFALPPISPEDPCGPDLDLEGDAEFLNFVAATEGLLPTAYYDFRRESIDFAAASAALDRLLQRTLDIRLFVLAVKLAALNRDLAGVGLWIGRLEWALRTHWQGVHPCAEDGDYAPRLGQLMTLQDNATLLLPLQYAPLVETTREGGLSYRDQLVASGAAQPRSITLFNEKGEKQTSAEEKLMPQKIIDKVLRDVEIEKLVAANDTLRGLAASIQSIHAVTAAEVGFEKSTAFPKLEKLVREMAEFVRGALVVRDPTLASPAAAAEGEGQGAESAGVASPPPAFATRADVDAALAAALGYFIAAEPTSPALLLIRQARETLGKNLYEVMKLLAPAHADNARVFVGPDGAFTVPVKSLSSAPSAAASPTPAEPAPSRAAALQLIDAVAQHMQRAEPSSPVPYLLERAKTLATRDFLSLLYDVLPEEAIASLKKGK